MAAKKRKSGGTKRAAPRRKTTSRRTTKSRKSTRRVTASKRRNPINPPKRRGSRRGVRRRSNPFLGGATSEVVNFTVAGISLGLFQPVVTRFVGGMLPFGQYNAPILSAGSGWLLSKGMEMFSFTRRFARPTLIFGLATAAMQILQPIVRGAIGGGGNGGNPTMQGWRRHPMRGIGVVTGIPPGIAPMPPMPAARNNSMQGIGMRPGNYGR